MLEDIKYGEIVLTPTDIERFKRKTLKKMAKQLKIDKKNGDLSKASKFSIFRVRKEVALFKADSNIDDFKEDLKKAQDIVAEIESGRNPRIKIEGVTFVSGRYDYYDKLRLKYDTYKFLIKASEENAKQLTRQWVSKCIYRKDWNSWKELKCNVMDLFKQGKISWDDVLQAHYTDCEI